MMLSSKPLPRHAHVEEIMTWYDKLRTGTHQTDVFGVCFTAGQILDESL
jgi:hypothetical protein